MRKIVQWLVCLVMASVLMQGCSDITSSKAFEMEDVTMDQLAEMMDSKETFVLLVERDGCTYCSALNEYIEQTQAEHNDLKVYKLDSTNFGLYREQEGDMTLISETDEGKAFLERFPYFLYTPALYQIQNGEPVQAGIGYDENRHTVSLWDVSSTIDFSSAKTEDVWTFIENGQPQAEE